jgi:hypothetical protein
MIEFVHKGMGQEEDLLSRNHTREMLKNSLLELDETWRRIYERAAELANKNASLLSALASKDRAIETLTAGRDYFEAQAKSLTPLSTENRYLRKALKEYLYPAIANEILKKKCIGVGGYRSYAGGYGCSCRF